MYGLSFFIVLTAYLGGGFAAMRLAESVRAEAAGYFFMGQGFAEMMMSAVIKRMILMAGQAVFSIWMAGMPLSLCCGMVLQISMSLPWAAMVKNAEQGIFIALFMLPQALISLTAGTYGMAAGMGHFGQMMGEMRIRKSAEDKLREGLPAIRRMLIADILMLACIPPEVLCFMNIM